MELIKEFESYLSTLIILSNINTTSGRGINEICIHKDTYINPYNLQKFYVGKLIEIRDKVIEIAKQKDTIQKFYENLENMTDPNADVYSYFRSKEMVFDTIMYTDEIFGYE